ncbi:MAG: hypothetical protein HQL87_16525 [Magnetococcales bacterium]|nr:hypothetical protein [Magnetococcales bacterium]
MDILHPDGTACTQRKIAPNSHHHDGHSGIAKFCAKGNHNISFQVVHGHFSVTVRMAQPGAQRMELAGASPGWETGSRLAQAAE